MTAARCNYETLADRENFNASVRHIKATLEVADRVASRDNLADALNESLDEKTITQDELLPFVSMILAKKFGYQAMSRNLLSVCPDFGGIAAVAGKWNAVDLVVVYSHPDLGVIVLNPKNPAHLSRIDRLNKCELMTVYAGSFSKPVNPQVAAKALDAMFGLLEGEKPKADAALLKGDCSYKARAAKAKGEAKAPAAKAQARKTASKGTAKSSGGKSRADAPQAEVRAPEAKAAAPVMKPGMRMTPMYSVVVSNELFHNGNVEAWKRVIESYKEKHPDLEVLVYYDGERITNLNALFKWGKVKHGSTIQFAVAGESICDVAKLQRYLTQGASIMFEAFLRGPVNTILPLF